MIKWMRQIKFNIRTKLFFAWTLINIIIIILIYNIIFNSVYKFNILELENKMLSDIQLIEYIVDPGDWYINNDNLYKGNTKIGNTISSNINIIDKFERIKKETDTEVNIFIKEVDPWTVHYICDSNGNLIKQGNYKKVIGIRDNKNENVNMDVYIEKAIADELDLKNIYIGNDKLKENNIYCIYQTLYNSSDEVVGAISINKDANNLKLMVQDKVNKIIFLVICCFVTGGIILYLLFDKWLKPVIVISEYLRMLDSQKLPEKQLYVKTNDEMEHIANAINNFVLSLKENQKLKFEVERDGLTGLYSRYWVEHYKKALIKSYSNQYISMIRINIDYFKEYNDAYGHDNGDKCLMRVAECIKSVFYGDNTYCIRLNSAEFLVLAFSLNAFVLEQKTKMLRLLISDMDIQNKYSKKDDKITVSIGAAIDKITDDFYDKALIVAVNELVCEAKRTNEIEIRTLFE